MTDSTGMAASAPPIDMWCPVASARRTLPDTPKRVSHGIRCAARDKPPGAPD
ncbi:hypothetical protein GCM10010402_81420 [Actinomadura luteofluorescens]